jgi:hypothetical protein
MIPIPLPPSKAGTILVHDDFFFASRSRSNIPVPDLSIIINQDNVDQYICAIPRVIELNDKRIPFYLQHTDLYKNVQIIYKDLFGVEPDVLLIYAYKNDSTKSAFLFSNRKFIADASVTKSPIRFNYNPHNDSVSKAIDNKIKLEIKNQRPINNIVNLDRGFEFTLPTGIFPVIGAYNDLTADDRNPSFNLIFGSFFSDRFYRLNKDLNKDDYEETISLVTRHVENQEWEGKVDSELKKQFVKGMPLYCLKNYNLKKPSLFEYFDPNNMGNYYQYVNNVCADDFVTVISNLLLSYSRGTYLPTELNEFAACMPHFYKVDRTEQSVRNTASLQNKLRNLYNTASDYGKGISSLNFKDFVEFFILESIIDFDLFFDDPGQELYKALVHKKTMSQLVGDNEILSRFLTNAIPNNDFNLFVRNQVNAKITTEPYI